MILTCNYAKNIPQWLLSLFVLSSWYCLHLISSLEAALSHCLLLWHAIVSHLYTHTFLSWIQLHRPSHLLGAHTPGSAQPLLASLACPLPLSLWILSSRAILVLAIEESRSQKLTSLPLPTRSLIWPLWIDLYEKVVPNLDRILTKPNPSISIKWSKSNGIGSHQNLLPPQA